MMGDSEDKNDLPNEREEWEDYDVETLIAEIEKERQMTDMLNQSVVDLQRTVIDMDDAYNQMEQDGGEWKTRFETQQETNQQLQRQIYELKEKLRQNKAVHAKSSKITIGTNNINELNEAGLKSLVRQMEREKANLEGQLRDFEWRLDQESKAFHKASESRRKYLTELNQASMMLSSYQRMQKMESKERLPEKRRNRAVVPPPLPEIRRGRQTMPKFHKDE